VIVNCPLALLLTNVVAAIEAALVFLGCKTITLVGRTFGLLTTVEVFERASVIDPVLSNWRTSSFTTCWTARLSSGL
jgi:hypothetical protein